MKEQNIVPKSIEKHLEENADCHLVIAMKDGDERVRTELRVDGDIADVFIMLDVVISKIASDLDEKPQFVLNALSELMAEGSYTERAEEL